MPKKEDLHPIQKASALVGIAAGILVISGSFFAWFSGLAFASDIASLEAKHDADIKAMQVTIYQKDIDALTLKPNKSQYDRDLLNLYQQRVDGLK